MKSLFLFLLVVYADAHLSSIPEMGRNVLLSLVPQSGRRVTRDLGGLNSKLPHIERMFKDQCQKNINELEPAIQSMKTCLRAKPVFDTPRDEYISQLERCSNETRIILKECLLPQYRFFPDLLLEIAKSVVKLVYDDSGEIIRGLGPCIDKLKTARSELDYLNCISRVNRRYDDEFPDSKTEFCQEFIEVNECFVSQIKDTCTVNEDLTKFTEDYMKAMKHPCQA